MAAVLGSDWGFWWLLAECGLKARFFPTILAGLNNQRGGEKLLFQRSGVTSGNILNLRGRLVDYLD
jgi:hypothetical protein